MSYGPNYSQTEIGITCKGEMWSSDNDDTWPCTFEGDVTAVDGYYDCPECGTEGLRESGASGH